MEIDERQATDNAKGEEAMMDFELANCQLQATCSDLGASFVLDQAEGEYRATVVCGPRWWTLIMPQQADEARWQQQLSLLRPPAS
ncbi:MAG: hypothetical protein LRY38_03405 [Aeromonadaceae bacterium]|nr:hypothetical protein [Aeromonadaceae bacterium]